MQHPGWVLVAIGGVLIGTGMLWVFGPSLPWLGRLPGDIVVERGNFRFYFPLATCVLLSMVLTAIVWLARQFSR